MRFVRAVGWFGLLGAVAYLAAFGSVVYIGDFAFGEGLFYLAPLAFGLALRHWWAVGVPLLVLLPLPILLAVAPPEADSEVGTVGLGFLVAFSTAIQCALVAVGVGLARRVSSLRRQPRPSG